MRVVSGGVAALCAALGVLVATEARAQEPQREPARVEAEAEREPPPRYVRLSSLPPRKRYREGDPIPPGYRLEETVRKGPIIAGAIVLGVPYVIGLSVASQRGFENESHWLAVPGLGPWMTLAARDGCDDDRSSNDEDDDLADCVGDVLLGTVLTLDGLMQATGSVLLIVGLTSKKEVLVREDLALTVRPIRIGRGHGLGISGTF